MVEIIERLAGDQDIRLEFPVKSINYEKDVVLVTSSGGQCIEASRVLVTVPLPILKDGILMVTRHE
jgi:monoamine oxidase